MGCQARVGHRRVLTGVVMKRIFRAVLAASALTLLVTQVSAVAASAETGRAGLQSHLDEVVNGGALAALAEVRDERGVWRGVSGFAEQDTTRTVPVNGRFRAGSLTKAFVATVVLQLVHERRLRLDDSVEARLPGSVPNGKNIEIKHLLNHTSGLPDYRTTLPMPPTPEFLQNRWHTWTAAELIQRAVANRPTSNRVPSTRTRTPTTSCLASSSRS